MKEGYLHGDVRASPFLTELFLSKQELSCYYVRRELRELSKRDLELFLDTFVTLFQTPTAEGVKTYGKNYRSLTDLCAIHLRAAGKRDSDHIHDGLALVTQHVAMTMEFELSMQTVAPRLAVPYWDYTIDATQLQAKFPGEYFTSISKMFFESELFYRRNLRFDRPVYKPCGGRSHGADEDRARL